MSKDVLLHFANGQVTTGDGRLIPRGYTQPGAGFKYTFRHSDKGPHVAISGLDGKQIRCLWLHEGGWYHIRRLKDRLLTPIEASIIRLGVEAKRVTVVEELAGVQFPKWLPEKRGGTFTEIVTDGIFETVNTGSQEMYELGTGTWSIHFDSHEGLRSVHGICLTGAADYQAVDAAARIFFSDESADRGMIEALQTPVQAAKWLREHFTFLDNGEQKLIAQPVWNGRTIVFNLFLAPHCITSCIRTLLLRHGNGILDEWLTDEQKAFRLWFRANDLKPVAALIRSRYHVDTSNSGVAISERPGRKPYLLGQPWNPREYLDARALYDHYGQRLVDAIIES